MRAGQKDTGVTMTVSDDNTSAEDTAVWAAIRSAVGSHRKFLPTHLAIEPTNGCNADCIMCPNAAQTRAKGVMSAETHRHIIDSIAAWGAPIGMISHAGLGDPLLDKRLEDKIAYEKGVFPAATVIVYTNAGLLDGARAERLLASGVDAVSVSINGFRADTYEQVMRLPRDTTYGNVERLLSLRDAVRPGVQVHVSLVRTELCREDEVREFLDFWRPRADQVILPPWISWGDHYAKPPSGGQAQMPCFYIWKTMMFDHDGTVKMCCEDFDSAYPLGNILRQPPEEIFNSAAMARLREAQLNGDFACPSICQGCAETYGPARDYWRTAAPVPAA